MSLHIADFDGMLSECCRASFVAEAANADKIVSESRHDVAELGGV